MNNKLFAGLWFCVFLICASPAHSTQTSQKSKYPEASTKTNIEVCNLLTNSEIQTVLGEAARQTKSSTQPGGGLLMSQCFFGMAGSAKSVSLAIARANPSDNSKLTPRALWSKQFHAKKEQGKEKEAKSEDRSEAEHEAELPKARVITGLGEEAFWVGNPILGALYVLKGDIFLRISVGGIRQEPDRIEKSKALAQAALKRL